MSTGDEKSVLTPLNYSLAVESTETSNKFQNLAKLDDNYYHLISTEIWSDPL